MIDRGKVSVIGVDVDAVDYEAAVHRIITAATDRRAYRVSALAVHGVMTGVDDDAHLSRLNAFDLITPDGQPVRWAMNWIHGTGLTERVYGPDLTLAVCREAAARGLTVWFHGSTPNTLAHLEQRLPTLVPGIEIAGTSPSTFATSTPEQLDAMAATIRRSGAAICFVGLGCPRQEVFVFENADRLQMPCLAVGAAFDFHAGLQPEPPAWMQRAGLQWLQRLLRDPRRLWRRYLVLNPRFVWRVAQQRIGRYRQPGELPPDVPPPHLGYS
jgi:N-acetylglucosaminyldiphosphoundecaprenol N-acetyl-beta-D-mannosaminyltransferase